MKEGWEVKTLGEIAELKGGKRVPKGYKLELQNTGYPYIRVADFNDVGSVDLDDIHYISKDVYEGIKRYIITDSDVYISIAGTIGKSGIIPKELNGANLTENACRLVLRPGLYNRFVYYSTINPFFKDQLIALTMQAAQPKLALTRLATAVVSVPPLPEQERIVSILDTEFAKIDALKANAEKNLQHAKDLFQAALKKELTPKEGWETKTISTISENLDYKRVPVTKKDRSQGIYPYYGASGIVDYVSDYLFDEELLLVSEDGANLVARSTPIAFSVSGKIWVNNHAHILRFSNIELQRFVEYFFAGLDISEYITGAAQPKFNQKALNNIKVTYPSTIEEQDLVVARLDTLNTHYKALQANYERTIALCDDMKQALLRKAFNGEL